MCWNHCVHAVARTGSDQIVPFPAGTELVRLFGGVCEGRNWVARDGWFCMCYVSAFMGKIEMGNSDLTAARREMQKTELGAEAALVWCHRFMRLKKSCGMSFFGFVLGFFLNYEVRFLQLVEGDENFTSMWYETIFHKTYIAVKCWGFLIG